MKDDDWIIVDTETDGISQPIHIVEIGAQLMRGWEPYGEPFHVLLNHNVPIPPEVVTIHGYTREFLRKHGIDPREAHAEFRHYAKGLPIVAHNLSFDWNRCFITEWQRLRLKHAGTRGFCTLMLARRVVFETDKHRLDVLRECFDLKVLKSHRALNDVKTLVELSYRVFGPRLESAGIRSFDDVLRFSARTPIANCLSLIESSQNHRKPITPSRNRSGKSSSRKQSPSRPQIIPSVESIRRQSTSRVVPARPSKQTIPSVPSVPATPPSRVQPTPPSLPAVKSLFSLSLLRRLRPPSPSLPPVESLAPTQPGPPPSQSIESRSPARFLFGKTATTHVVLVPPKIEIEIGRADEENGWCPDVDLTPYGGTAEAGISRHHAKITRRSAWMIEDMNSVNGTYLNGQCLTPGQETPLASGDTLTLGDLQFTFIA